MKRPRTARIGPVRHVRETRRIKAINTARTANRTDL